MEDKELQQLIAAWLDGRLSAEDSLLLQQELRESDTARLKFRQYAQIDVALHEVADSRDLQGPAELIAEAARRSAGQTRSGDPTEDATNSRSQLTLPPERLTRRRNNSVGRLTAWYTAAAAAMLIVFAAFSYFRMGEPSHSEPVVKTIEVASNPSPRKPPAPVATLASADRARWENSQLNVGQALYEGDSISLQAGKARISVGFGAELVAEAPCMLSFLASDRVQLHKGNVAVDVAPWAKGFTVVTDEMDIVDLGTTFTVSASPGVKSETTVLKGLVRVHPSKVRKQRPRGLLVKEGQQVSIDDQGLLKNVEQPETLPQLSSFDFGVTGPYRPVELSNTGIGLAVGDEDQHWRVVAGPDSNFRGPQYATVCVPHERYLQNYPNVSQWISIADWQTAAANSVYTFQTEFDLEGYDLNTMQLFGRFLADNGIAAVRVNDEPVQVQSWVDNVVLQPFGDPQFRFVNVTEGLVRGRNIIEVDVRNGMQRQWHKESKEAVLSAIPNPMALRVEWYAFGRQHNLAKSSEGAALFRQLQEEHFPTLTLANLAPEN